MYKSITILYIVCFACYVFFTRQPDYLDGEKSPATIHFVKNAPGKIEIPMAVFNDGHKQFSIDARYFFRELSEGEKLEVIYETDHPEKAVVYRFWGYWLTWGELLATVLIYIGLFQVAVSVTKNPTPEAVMDQLEYIPEKKKRYDE